MPKKALTGENTERVDTRVLQVVYAIEPPSTPSSEEAAKTGVVFVGQQLDVFIDGDNAADGSAR